MNTWYISDTHWGHFNIIKFCNRPFKDTIEMDQALMDYWAETVKPQDHITHLGDITMLRGGGAKKEAFIKQMRSLPGHKRLLLGNHDHFSIQTYLEAGFEKIYATHRTNQRILLSHYPVHPSSIGSAIANVHGHTHDQPNIEPALYVINAVQVKPYLNISVEHTDYKPIHLDEVMDQIRLIKLKWEDGVQ